MSKSWQHEQMGLRPHHSVRLFLARQPAIRRKLIEQIRQMQA